MITFASVTKAFPESGFTLENVSFHINKGELVLLTGHSGSGKTTLMRLLTREYLPTSGSIHFGNLEVTKLKSSLVPYLRRKIGVVFQDYKLLPELNIWENIALPLSIVNKPQHEIESRVTDLLKLVDLTERAFLFPSQLSGGEAQRVSIARALAIGPEVIFADEPTGNLDKETSLVITRLLHKINELGTTLILATHDSDVLQSLADTRRIHMDKGRLVQDTHPQTPSHSSAVTAAPLPSPQVESEPNHPKAASAPKSSESKKTAPPTEPAPKPAAAPHKAKTRFSLALPKFQLPFGKKKVVESKPPTTEKTPTSVEELEEKPTPAKKEATKPEAKSDRDEKSSKKSDKTEKSDKKDKDTQSDSDKTPASKTKKDDVIIEVETLD